MAKNILIFSDGTGQIGGIKPDQRLSNIYKMYRAMRPGPDSPISPKRQVAFYDPGLGSAETEGGTLKKIRRAVEAGVGEGIDTNVIDCYEKIIAYYEPGDEVLLFGFSRGAYTARSVANVMNLCGIPTRLPDGSPIPRFGPELRKIATDAVKYVYNHGAGYPRGEEPYYSQREEKGRRFRAKYACAAEGEKCHEQGNVQPKFVGVFDTVAALDSKIMNSLSMAANSALVVCLIVSFYLDWPWYISALLGVATATIAVRLVQLWLSQWKYFSPDPDRPLRLSNPSDWWSIYKNGHRAVWSKKNYDRYLDSDVMHARQALSIDECRADFPRVAWGSREESAKADGRSPEWLRQVWFAGCHSDIGGSYPEDESRLSDITLEWMIGELKECVPSLEIRNEMLQRWPDSEGLQHAEVVFWQLGPFKIKWRIKPRDVNDEALLHPSVIERFKAGPVPQLGECKPYRPVQLKNHAEVREFYEK
jgi:uncharacterized protein (DUF2235 family)